MSATNDLRAMRPLGEPMTGHTSLVTCLAWSPGGAWLASGSYDGTVRLCAFDGLRHVRTLEGHTGTVMGVAFTAGGGLASCGKDGTVRRWAAP